MKDIEKLIIKFLLKEANFDELQQLERWVNDPKNETIFLEYIKIIALLNKVMGQYDTDKAKERIISLIRKEKNTVPLPIYKRKVFKYASFAVLIATITSTYFLKSTLFNLNTQQATPIIINNQIKPGINKATLILENGEEVTLVKGKTFQKANFSSNGEEIVYESSDTEKKEMVFNTLKVPRGAQFSLKLADDTKVWLNSDSQLKYPVSFIKGETRKVELMYGEAYFEVATSKQHQGADFKVIHNQQEVQVLGTAFNIKAYPGETNIYTTLVEGSIALKTKDKTEFLKPGDQASLHFKTHFLSINQIDVYNEVSWKDGVFIFNRKSLKDIMKVLERWYDVEVDFENKKLENIGFNGVLNKNQNILDILNSIKSYGTVKNFEINNKKVILK